MTIFCRSCGSQLDDGAAFCGSCGTPVLAAAAAAAPPPPPSLAKPGPAPIPPPAAPPPQQPPYYPPTPPQAAANSTLPWIIVAILAVAIALAAVYFATRGGGEGDPAAETAATEAGDSAEVASVMPAPTPVGPVVTKFVTGPANIRSMPTAQAGTGSAVVSTLRAGTQVQGQMVVGPGNAYWLQLTDGRGFVSAINLSDGPPLAAPAPVAQGDYRAPVSNGVFCAVATQTGNLRVRSTPAGRIVGGMPRGARFQMYGQSVFASGYYWVQIQPADVRYPGGWVASEHIRC